MTSAIDIINQYIRLELEDTIDKYMGYGYETLIWSNFEGEIYRKGNPVTIRRDHGYDYAEIWFEKSVNRKNNSSLCNKILIRDRKNLYNNPIIIFIFYPKYQRLVYNIFECNKSTRSHERHHNGKITAEHWEKNGEILSTYYDQLYSKYIIDEPICDEF